MNFKKIFWTTSLILLVLFMYFMPKSFLYLLGEDKSFWINAALIFIVIPFIIVMNFISYKSFSNWMLLFLIPNPVFLGPTFGIWHSYQKEQELKQYGVKGKGVVTELKYQTGKNKNTWKIECEFIVKDEKYDATFVEWISQDEYSPPYKIGDTVEIIYSSIFPKINEVESKYEKKYNKKRNKQQTTNN